MDAEQKLTLTWGDIKEEFSTSVASKVSSSLGETIAPMLTTMETYDRGMKEMLKRQSEMDKLLINHSRKIERMIIAVSVTATGVLALLLKWII